MAIINFVSGKIVSLKDDGSVNAGGKVYFYVIGTSIPKDTYPTADDAEAMTNANANPLILDSAGRGTAFLNGDYKVIVYDSNDVQIYSTDRVNPTTTVTTTARSAAYTLIGTDNEGVTEASGTFTLTLTSAATLKAGWQHYVKNVGAGTVTVARANAGDTINGTAANLTLVAGQGAMLRVIEAETGFITDNSPAVATTYSGNNTFPGTNTFTPIQLFTAGIGPSFVNNYSLAGSVAANALTITLSGYDGTALSSTNKAQFMFRNVTAGTGTTAVVESTANLTLTISSGSTLGATSAVPFRVWIVLLNDGGTLRLGAINCSTTSNLVPNSTAIIYPLSDDSIASSSAEGGAGGADSAGTIYTGSAVTSKAMRVLGYMDFSLTTAGTWDEAPDKVQLWQTGMKLPGDIVGSSYKRDGATTTTTTTLPGDNTVPQNTEGAEFTTLAYAPSSAANLLFIDGNAYVATDTTSSHAALALFQDTTADAIVTAVNHTAGTNAATKIALHFETIASSTTSRTYKLRYGVNAGGTTRVNGSGGAGLYGGVLDSCIRVQEIMG